MARPRKEIDGEQVYRLAKRGCSQREIGDYFGVAHTTIGRNYAPEFERGSAECKTLLRSMQFRRAAKGSDKMLVHLGMVYLNQRHAVDVQTHKPIAYVERASNARDLHAISSNGNGHTTGNGVSPQSPPEAMETD